ncbi:MAG: hypothetical protein ACUVRA_05260 [Candidatus Bathyarchaeaceae archaeon]
MSRKEKIKATFMVMLFVTTFMVSLLPEVAIAEVTISIEPKVGYVGDTIRVNGTIETPNGNYTIFFDGALVKKGTAVETKVNDTFVVPHYPKGNYTVVLQDVGANKNVTATFSLKTKCYIKAVAPPPPKQLQEGISTEIWINVTGEEVNTVYFANITVKDPANENYWAITSFNITTTGYGEASVTYPTNFSAGAHMNYIGTYNIAFNQTLASGNFAVGLTNATEYYRFQVVNIRAAGYQADETVYVNITHAGEIVFSENPSAIGGVVEINWKVPHNASFGLYTVTVTNSTASGTVKPIPDIQNFTVIEKIIPISIYPTNGSWGTTVRVEGENVKPGGSYQIRWDGEPIKTGNCGSGSVVVNDTFIVPASVKGYHNITLYDVNQTIESMPVTFEVTTFCYVLAKPTRILEGERPIITVGVQNAKANVNYTFTINITDPLNRTRITTSRVATNSNGLGENYATYPENFTNYLGTYTMTVNGTLATGTFTVGITDKTEYRRTKDVIIQGSGYGEQEFIIINITYAKTGETVFSENRSTYEGIVACAWTIPENATLGIYTVTLSYANGTYKPKKPDIQNFTVIKVIVHCQAQNKYDNQSLAGVTIEAYINETLVASGATNKTGWVDFIDSMSRGNCTFKALWKNETVSSLTENVTAILTEEYILQKAIYIPCELSQVTITVNDEAGYPLPFINIILTSNKTGSLSFKTNYAGIMTTNTFTNISYTIEAQRYGHLFNRTLIENLTFTLDINIVCPTYTLFAQVLDSKELPLQNATVSVYEWESKRFIGSRVTNNLGSITMSCTFGRYTVRVQDLESGVILNETIIDLVEDSFFFVIHCRISNVDLSVVVKDYFGHPIPNAKVKVERDGVNIATLTTGSNGTVSLPKIIGGNCRISVYVGGELCETRTLYLDETKVVVFKLERFIVFRGYPLETTQLVAGTSLGIVIALFALALIYRRLRTRKVSEEKEKSL